MQQPRGSVGRTRFLLALSLSTVTAAAVAAPLALQAMHASDPDGAVTPASDGTGVGPEDDLLSDEDTDRSLEGDGEPQGGIEAKPASGPKALSETGKGGDQPSVPPADDDLPQVAPAPTTTTSTTTAPPPTEPEESPSGRPVRSAPPVDSVPTTGTTVPTVSPGPTVTSSTTTSTTVAPTTTTAPEPDTTDGSGADQGER